MPTAPSDFDQLQLALQQGGVGRVLEQLGDRLRADKQYHQLFEARKMAVRWRLGLPFLYGDSSDDLPEATRTQLENGLLDACREVGLLLMAEGKVREGWMYLRPVGDKAAAKAALDQIAVDEDNLEAIIEVALHEGVDPVRGFGLVLEHYGTCNSITTFDSAMHQRSVAERQAAAGMLVEHLHKELLHNVKHDIRRQEGSDPHETTLRALVADRDWLFLDNAYHIDTTHLSSTIRFARLLENAAQLRLALDLTEYGRRLGAQFQYQGDEPFADIYPSHALYFQALLGEYVDEALAYFRGRAETVDLAQHGTVAIESYIAMLARLGRYREAIDAALQLMPPDAQPLGVAPPLLELCQKAGDYTRWLDLCRERGDLLGFATGLVHTAR